jgi:hypothetical protein
MSTVTHHLNHSIWACKYHVVFTLKYRKKDLYGIIRWDLRATGPASGTHNGGVAALKMHI